MKLPILKMKFAQNIIKLHLKSVMLVNKSVILLFAVSILLLSGVPMLLEPKAYYIIREELYFNFFSLLSLLLVSIFFFTVPDTKVVYFPFLEFKRGATLSDLVKVIS